MKYVINVFTSLANEDGYTDTTVASFGPFTHAEKEEFVKKNMGALAHGLYWDFSALHTTCGEFAHLFIPGTRNNPAKG